MADQFQNSFVYPEADKHLDSTISKDNFLSAARCIIYAAPYKDAGGVPVATEFHRIGVVQGYNFGEQRQIEHIFELGSDIPYIVPGRTTGQISIARILLFGADLTNIFFYSDKDVDSAVTQGDFIKSLRDINKPIDLLFASFSNNDAQAVYSRLFVGCWLQSRSESIAAGQVLIAENVNIMYEQIAAFTVPQRPK